MHPDIGEVGLREPSIALLYASLLLLDSKKRETDPRMFVGKGSADSAAVWLMFWLLELPEMLWFQLAAVIFFSFGKVKKRTAKVSRVTKSQVFQVESIE